MKFEVDTDTLLQKITDKMLFNVENNAKGQGLSDEEVAATVVLNKKKVTKDAENIARFITSIYVEEPAETPAE